MAAVTVNRTRGAAVRSMTGFASRQGGDSAGRGWSWEVRSVNSRGLDLRLRLPEGIDGLEPAARKALTEVASRGALTLSLRLERSAAPGALRLDADALAGVLAALARVQEAAEAADIALAPPSAAEILSLRGVVDSAGGADLPEAAALLADLPALLADFDAMRTAEGAALATVLEGQLARVAGLVDEAAAALPEREARLAETLAAGVERLLRTLGNAGGPAPDPARLEQELALILVKSDIAEELDRLRAHVAAARAMLAEAGAVGRKLDFLMQEFNREANTLCAKAQSGALTRIGLDLKAVIDQMREQVQNLE